MPEYINHLAVLFCIYGVLALSLNILVGYTGLISLAHASFYGVGAYVTAILTTRFDINFFVSAGAGALLAMVVSLAIGLVLSKFRGDYYLLGAIGFNAIMFAVMLNWQDLTRGPLGISGIERPEIFGFSFSDNLWFLILCLTTLGLVYWFLDWAVKTPFGRVLKAIREDEVVAEVFGYKVLGFKLLAFVVGAGLAAIAGSLYAAYITYIDPTTFTLNESIFVLSIIILGGLASLEGALLGTLCLILLPEALRFVGFPSEIAGQMRALVYGLILVILMLYRPQGLMGKFKL